MSHATFLPPTWARSAVSSPPAARVVGAHILAPAAGEMIAELALAITRRLKLSEVAGSIHVYPTPSLGINQLAAEAAYQSAQKFHWLVRRQRRP
jgi:hypothetical protein